MKFLKKTWIRDTWKMSTVLTAIDRKLTNNKPKKQDISYYSLDHKLT